MKDYLRVHTPVIIIGAPRSGTNVLRDLLCRVESAGTWNCDEINYIWRHGNVRHPDDEFTASMARPGVREYIRRKFVQLAAKKRLDYVVEKTCANSLRVAFVNAVIPNARFIFIVRDGRDAAWSAVQRWRAPLDLAYILRKLRYVPATDLPYYGALQIYNRCYRLVASERRVAFWGPKFAGMAEALAERDLYSVCALQWQRCVNLAARDLSIIDEARVHRLRYEDLVATPGDVLRGVAQFLGCDERSLVDKDNLNVIYGHSVNRSQSSVAADRRQEIEALIRNTLDEYEYP